MNARIDFDGQNLVFYSPYNAALVRDLKWYIPGSERQWNKAKGAWIIDPAHGQILSDLCAQYLGQLVLLPNVTQVAPTIEQRILEVRYVGAAKDRDNGERTALGWMNGFWSVVFPEKVLRTWFEDESKPGDETTLFNILGIKQGVTEAEVKTAYRRMAKQWHPDVCKEPDASEQFKRINEAYQVLSDPIKRAKYEAGLKLAASTDSGKRQGAAAFSTMSYRSPLRCGLILATGTERLGRFVVEKIEQWADITDGQGRVLVTSWLMGADKPVETWS